MSAARLVGRLLAFAAGPAGAHIEELEINPLALTPEGPVALDVLVTLRRTREPPAPARPVHKIGKLLHLASIALVGVSRGVNPGRRILGNILRVGFPQDRIAIVKPGVERMDGVRCYPDIAELPGPGVRPGGLILYDSAVIPETPPFTHVQVVGIPFTRVEREDVALLPLNNEAFAAGVRAFQEAQP